MIFLLFLLLLGGLVEMSYLYRAKHTLNSATFEAARAGALHHALPDPMNHALVRGMAALYMRGERSPEGLARAVAEAEALLAPLNAIRRAITIISPTREMFDKLKVEQKLRLQTEPGDAPMRKLKVLPNDNLNWRPRTTRSVTVNGKDAGINVQDANLLKLRSYWCHRLIVPVVDRLLAGIAAAVNVAHDPQAQAACTSLNGTGRYHILIASKAVIRMQSPVLKEAYGG